LIEISEMNSFAFKKGIFEVVFSVLSYLKRLLAGPMENLGGGAGHGGQDAFGALNTLRKHAHEVYL
jgi:hypothetical protein